MKNMVFALFLGLFLSVWASPAHAEKQILDLQNYVRCGIDSCTLSVDVNELDLTKEGKNLVLGLRNDNKDEHLSQLPDTVKSFDLQIKDKEKLIVTAKIAAGSQNYWFLEFETFILHPWFNSSYPYCRNFTINNTLGNYYQNLQYVFNITNLTDFVGDGTHELFFINDSVNGANSSVRLPHWVNTSAAGSWVSGLVKVDYIANGTYRNLSFCYGNNSTDFSSAQETFDLYDDFSGTLSANWTNNSVGGCVILLDSGNLYIRTDGAVCNVVSNVSLGEGNISFEARVLTNYSTTAIYNYIGMGGLGGFADNHSAFNLKDNNELYIVNRINGDDTGGYTLLNLLTTEWQTYRIVYANASNSTSFFMNNTLLGNKDHVPADSFVASFGDFFAGAGAGTMTIDYVRAWQYQPYTPPYFIGAEEEYAPPAVTYDPITDATTYCFKTQPVCLNLKDSTIIYKGSGYYG